jgi:hypothetical protein
VTSKVKASKETEFARAFLILLITSITFFGVSFTPGVSASFNPEIYIIVPETVDVEEANIFNVTVLLSGDIESIFFYQIGLNVNDSIVSIGRAWIPIWNNSWIFHGKMTVTPDPTFMDTNGNHVCDSLWLGSSLLSFGMPFNGTSLLAIIELEIKSSPSTALLNIDNIDTFVLDEDMGDLDIEKQDKSVNIIGSMPTETSEITIDVNPKIVLPGQNVTIVGQIIPDKPGVSVKIEQKPEPNMQWSIIAMVKTNQTSQYKFVCSFSDPGSPELQASWTGDATHKGDTSETVKISVVMPYTELEIRFANEDVTYIGKAQQLLPTPFPTTLNVTVFNVTDLQEWMIKIYYDSDFMEINTAWLPADNIFSLKDVAYTSNVDKGIDERGRYLCCNATAMTGVNCSGYSTLFQFNVTGLFMTSALEPPFTLLSPEPVLKNSIGNEIALSYENFELMIIGHFPTKVTLTDPNTGGRFFKFFSDETSVGTTFNATLLIEEAIDLSGWRLELTYNATLLNVTNVMQPIESDTYVFGLNSKNFTWSNENGTARVENFLDELEEPFNGDGLLTIIEFKILLAPTNETEELSCDLKIKLSVFSGSTELWQTVDKTDGQYVFEYGGAGEDGDNEVAESIWDYWPYIAGVIVIIVVVYLVLKKVRKGEEYIEAEDWET